MHSMFSFGFKKRTKILFAGHDLKFVDEIIQRFESLDSVEVKVDLWKGHTGHDALESAKLLKWADVILCEWCLGNAVWYSNHKKRKQKLYIGLHRQEIVTTFLEEVNGWIDFCDTLQEKQISYGSNAL